MKKLTKLLIVCIMMLSCVVTSSPVHAKENNPSISFEDFIWPDKDGRYSITYDNCTPESQYMLFVVKGIYQSLNGVDLADIVDDVLYLNQKKSLGSSVSFDGFIPNRIENSTIIISGNDTAPFIAGYISKDCFSHVDYAYEINGKRINDLITIPLNDSGVDVESLLPKTGYAIIANDFGSSIYVKVNFEWNTDLHGRLEVSDFFNAYGTATIVQDNIPAGVISVLKPLNVVVNISDEYAGIVGISASKDKTIYNIGDELNADDIRVMALFDDGTIRELNEFEYDDIVLDSEGIKPLTVRYREFETNIDIIVNQPSEKYQISFETNGATLMAPIYTEGKIPYISEKPEKPGYVFMGWYYDAICKKPVNYNDELIDNVTLYAKWRNVFVNPVYDVQVSMNFSILETGDAVTKEMINVKAIYSNDTERTIDDFEYDLSYVNNNEPGTYPIVVKCSEDGIVFNKTVYIEYVKKDTLKMYDVTYDIGVDGKVIKQKVISDGVAVRPADPSKEGYIFAGWSLNGAMYDFSKHVTADINLEVVWARPELLSTNDGNFYVYLQDEQCYQYTGKAITPVPVVVDHYMNVLKNKTDYTVKYSNNTKVTTDGNKAKITVTGKGNYAGTITIPFEIEKNDITPFIFSVPSSAALKNGKVSPSVSVKNGKTSLKAGTDYAITYMKEGSSVILAAPLTEAGNYTVSIVGKGNYSGEKTFALKVLPQESVNLSSVSLNLDKNYSTLSYTGQPQYINSHLTVTYKKTELVEGVDYKVEYTDNHTNIGKVSYVIKPTDSTNLYYGEKSGTFTISGISISTATADMNYSSVAYNGSLHHDALKSVLLKVNAKNMGAISSYKGVDYKKDDVITLAEGIDYIVRYEKATNVGKATVCIDGIGLFTGTLKKTFTITPVELLSGDITCYVASAEASKAGAIPNVNIYYKNDKLLKVKSDYTLSATNNVNAGNGKLTISGKGNFKGKLIVSFEVTKKKINSSDISIVVENLDSRKLKPGKLIKPTITVTDNGKKLKEGSDYILDTSGCVMYEDYVSGDNRGYVLIKGNGKTYTGAKRVYYTVADKDISKQSIAITNISYTGTAVVFDLKKDTSMFETTLEPGKDFIITAYKNNIKPGKGSVTIFGKGEYYGKKTVNFVITKLPLGSN